MVFTRELRRPPSGHLRSDILRNPSELIFSLAPYLYIFCTRAGNSILTLYTLKKISRLSRIPAIPSAAQRFPPMSNVGWRIFKRCNEIRAIVLNLVFVARRRLIPIYLRGKSNFSIQRTAIRSVKFYRGKCWQIRSGFVRGDNQEDR